MVVADTARTLSERFGKILQKRQSISINRTDTSTSISTQMDSIIPASKISSLTQGTFVGCVADDFGQEIKQKTFHCKIKVDLDKLKEETEKYEKIPKVITPFINAKTGEDNMEEQIKTNYMKIKEEVSLIVELETERMKSENDKAKK